MKDVHIKVYDKQTYETHDDTNETEFEGQLAFKNDSVYITYKDEEMGVRTIIKTKDNVISVIRQGGLKANLEFDTQNPHKTIYYTPYGEMEIEIITKKCEVYILEKGVKICIDYKILMQGKTISDNIYMIIAN
ncbi:MAG: hypothetical protein K0S71_1273 [Clostridia bacterium]|jgi:uncharacterized beta-barrel protein YwiB (DUF1934 family)|nr:hypothetical protein [Clostridia bacterium]